MLLFGVSLINNQVTIYVLCLSHVLAVFYFGVVHFMDIIVGVNELVLLQMTYLFGVTAIIDKRIIGKQPYVQHYSEHDILCWYYCNFPPPQK